MNKISKIKITLLWLLTIVITLSSVVYQRATGPTYPVRGSIDIAGQNYSYKLLRSQDTSADAEMKIYAPNREINGELRYKRYKSSDNWTTEPLERRGDSLLISVPKQPMAGKVIYQVSLIDPDGGQHSLTNDPVVIRFKGAVPLFILLPHILLMFAGMLFATRAGLEAIVDGINKYRFTFWTIVLLFVGGIVLGPIVQKYAFGTYWSGWPFGNDLTDNKTLVIFIFWLIAIWRLKIGKSGRAWIITAAIITLLVYLIPHSVFGSEIDYTKPPTL